MQNIWYGSRGNREGKIIIVGESWGKQEAFQQLPFVGETGQDLDRLLAESGIPHNECFFTNVVSAQPDFNEMSRFFYTNAEAKKHKHIPIKGLFPHPNVIQGLQRLKAQISAIKPTLIIGLGNYALWALTDDSFDINSTGTNTPTGIGKWRGSQLYTSHELGHIPFLPTYHPAAAMHSTPAWRYMIKHDLSTRVKLALNNSWEPPAYDFTIRPNFETVTSFLRTLLIKLENQRVSCSLDIETDENGFISCIGLALNPRSAICVPFFRRGEEQRYWSFEEELVIVGLFRAVLSHPHLDLIGQNLLFDFQCISEQLFVKPRIGFDTMIAQHVLFPGGGEERKDEEGRQEAKARQSAQGIQRKALFNLSSLYCAHHAYWKEDRHSNSEDEYWRYNCTDAVRTFEIAQQQAILLGNFGLSQQFEFQVRVANDMALPMMLRGVKVNEETRKATVNKLETAMFEFDKQLLELIPLEMRKLVEPKAWKKNPITGIREKAQWFTSAAQQKTIFYDFLGIKPLLHPKTKKPTLNKEALPILAGREPILQPIVEKLETRRSIGVYLSTFGRAELDDDGRMRCSYNVTGTDTYRFSSSENIHGRGGNLQNIPSGKEDDSGFEFPNMRAPFQPDIGYELAEYDLSGADAAVVAWEADDEELKTAFRNNLKLHLLNARSLFPEQTSSMTDDEIKAGSGIPGSIYDGVKKGVHGTNYGAKAKTLSTKLKWSMAKAEEFQERWFYLHPGIRKWHERTENYLSGIQCWRCDSFIESGRKCKTCNATTGRTVGNRFGYRIVYFDEVGNLLNKALAWCPQSTVGINANKGAIALVDNFPWIELLLQVHDSVVVQYPIKYSDPFYQLQIKNVLHSVIVPYRDPLQIKWGVKTARENWGTAETKSWPEG